MCATRPIRRAATAVARQWFDWIPPTVITQSQPEALASASRNSSLRTLFPDSSLPVQSSRLIWNGDTAQIYSVASLCGSVVTVVQAHVYINVPTALWQIPEARAHCATYVLALGGVPNAIAVSATL
eukprot:SAG31_NODE_1985_length_6715_cov_6.562924_2_plen_126_part_00